MNEPSKKTIVQPELEARIVALVLGEASDFERDELSRLIQERPELAAVRDRFTRVHKLMQDSSTFEQVPEDESWTLPKHKRSRVLAAIDGKPLPRSSVPFPGKRLVTESLLRGGSTQIFGKVASIVSIAGLFGMIAIAAMFIIRPRQLARLSGGTGFTFDSHEHRRDAAIFGEHDFAAPSEKFKAGFAVDRPAGRTNTPLWADSSLGLEHLEQSVELSVSPPSQYYFQDDVQYYRADPDSKPSIKAESNGVFRAIEKESNSNAKQGESAGSPGSSWFDSSGEVTIGGSNVNRFGRKERELNDLTKKPKSQPGAYDERMLYEFAESNGGVEREKLEGRGGAAIQESPSTDDDFVVGQRLDANRAIGGGTYSGGMGGGGGRASSLDGSMPAKNEDSVWLRFATPGKSTSSLGLDFTSGDDLGGGDEGFSAGGAFGNENQASLSRLAESPPTRRGMSTNDRFRRNANLPQSDASDAESRFQESLSVSGVAEGADFDVDLDGLQDDVTVWFGQPNAGKPIDTEAYSVNVPIELRGRYVRGSQRYESLSENSDKDSAELLLGRKASSLARAGLQEVNAKDEAFSTFSLHVGDVSFKLAQAALRQGQWPDASKIRIEEFVNAFDYRDPLPSKQEKVSCRLEQSVHPFLQQRNLLRVSMRTAAAGRASETPLRLTLLLDNSGSMDRMDRRATVRRAVALLAAQLHPRDQVTLISFARQPRLLADKVSGSDAATLIDLIENLPSEGGTNIESALQLAFEKAQEQQSEDAQNRVILLTDGAVNLGDANPLSLSQMIITMRDAGISFDAGGISADGLNDEVLEALTRKGDGRYYLLDSMEAADSGFARQIAGALRPSAKNVKVQVEFNPKRVEKYKLLGFENHRLKQEDFRNDKVDAAEMTAAEAGVALYQFEAKPDGEGDIGSVSVRFRDLSTGQMVENRWPIPYQRDAVRTDQAEPSLRIASAAAFLAAKLKGDPIGETVDLKVLSDWISGLDDQLRNTKQIQSLQQMLQQARQLTGK